MGSVSVSSCRCCMFASSFVLDLRSLITSPKDLYNATQ